jgi:hypothetical protein
VNRVDATEFLKIAGETYMKMGKRVFCLKRAAGGDDSGEKRTNQRTKRSHKNYSMSLWLK